MVAADDVYDPIENRLLIEAGAEIAEDEAQAIEDAGMDHIKIRSVLTCESKRGVCARCYGRNLANGRLVDIGEAVGVIAAQSIGEPRITSYNVCYTKLLRTPSHWRMKNPMMKEKVATPRLSPAISRKRGRKGSSLATEI